MVLTESNGLALGPEAKARVAFIKESWFFFRLLAAAFETMNLYISIKLLEIKYLVINNLLTLPLNNIAYAS